MWTFSKSNLRNYPFHPATPGRTARESIRVDGAQSDAVKCSFSRVRVPAFQAKDILMRHIKASWIAVVGIYGISACGNSETGFKSSSDAGPSAATACADIAHAQCEKRDSCSLGSFSNNRMYGSEADCEARVTKPCVSSLSAQGTGQTPGNIETCVALYSNYSCTDYRDNNPSGACLPPAGSRQTSAACGANGQCASTFCHIAQYQTCGICTDLPKAGTPCTYGGDCGRNMDCAIPTGATSGACAALVANGGACLTGTNPCQAGFACVGDNETNGTAGTCQPHANTVGAACDRSRKTAANCDAEFGLTCIPTAAGSAVGTCQKISLVSAGQTCGVIGSAPITGEAVCNAGGQCVKANSTDNTGTCVGFASDGTACNSDPAAGPPCLPPAKCVSATAATAGTCVVPDATQCQ